MGIFRRDKKADLRELLAREMLFGYLRMAGLPSIDENLEQCCEASDIREMFAASRVEPDDAN